MNAPQATEFLSGGQRANILHISLYLVISRYICYISLYPAISGPDIVKYPVQRRVSWSLPLSRLCHYPSKGIFDVTFITNVHTSLSYSNHGAHVRRRNGTRRVDHGSA